MKKRIYALILLLLFVASLHAEADSRLRGYDKEGGYIYVLYGAFPQTIDGGVPGTCRQAWDWRVMYSRNKEKKENREHGIWADQLEKQPILWRVLSVDEEKAYLCSEYVLFAAALTASKRDYDASDGYFPETPLWHYLNTMFYAKAFTLQEREALVPDKKQGKVYLLSVDELNDRKLGFGTKLSRKAYATEAAVRAYGVFVYSRDIGGHTPYWTRDSSKKHYSSGLCTKQEGNIGYYSCLYEEQGVRPVINISLNGCRIESGRGTKDAPYVIIPSAN